MARALWSGSISFGLVNVPVRLVTAAADHDYHFRQLHAKDDVPIEQRRFCAKEDVEISWEETGHGYDLNGKQVVLTHEELASVEPRKTRTIEIEAFVTRSDIDPIYFDHPYYLVPAGESEGTFRAYRLLVEVMADEEKMALGRFVMRTKEYLAAIRARDGALALTTMLFGDEVRPTAGIPTRRKRPARKVVDNAVAIIEELSTEWEPDKYEDCYRERLRRVIDQKRKGGTVTAPEPEKQPKPAPDLMKALEATLERVKSGDTPDEIREQGGEDGDGDLDSLSREELYERAQEAKVPGRSKMGRRELVKALKDR
jgi:DNA end-binding protein Ku